MDDSFAKGLRLLEVLSAAEKPLGLTEIAARCKLIKSHTHKFLRTLL
jgi:DNA-binding IclR family transcriptional regulator